MQYGKTQANSRVSGERVPTNGNLDVKNVRSRFQYFHEFGKVNPFMLYFYHEYMDTRYMVNNGAEVENVIV